MLYYRPYNIGDKIMLTAEMCKINLSAPTLEYK